MDMTHYPYIAILVAIFQFSCALAYAQDNTKLFTYYDIGENDDIASVLTKFPDAKNRCITGKSDELLAYKVQNPIVNTVIVPENINKLYTDINNVVKKYIDMPKYKTDFDAMPIDSVYCDFNSTTIFKYVMFKFSNFDNKLLITEISVIDVQTVKNRLVEQYGKDTVNIWTRPDQIMFFAQNPDGHPLIIAYVKNSQNFLTTLRQKIVEATKDTIDLKKAF